MIVIRHLGNRLGFVGRFGFIGRTGRDNPLESQPATHGQTAGGDQGRSNLVLNASRHRLILH
jgi:hypothetical protein